MLKTHVMVVNHLYVFLEMALILFLFGEKNIGLPLFMLNTKCTPKHSHIIFLTFDFWNIPI